MKQTNLKTLKFSHHNIEGRFTLRSADIPENGNMALHVCKDPAAVLQARNQLACESLPLSQWVLACQKHTDQIVQVYAEDAGRGSLDADDALGPADGLYTTEPGLLLGVFTADCLGILLSDPTIPLIAAVHSGWKGTAQAILYKMLKTLQNEGLLHPDTLQVHFSPSLLFDSLEVGPEVVEELENMAEEYGLNLDGCIRPGQGDRSFADNQGINVRMLESFGIPEENIFLSDLDTRTHTDCFSFRRDGRLGGEHFSCLWIAQKN